MHRRRLKDFLAGAAVTISLAAAAVSPSVAADAKGPAAKPAQAEIPFANLGGIEDWRADGDKALYLEGRNRQWYHAELMSPCIGLPFAEHIGFTSEPMGTFDRFSSIVVQHEVCQVTSLVKSDPPPKKK